MVFTLDGFDCAAFVTGTLAEDIGPGGDLTSAAVIPEDARFTGLMTSRDAIVVAGVELAAAFFARLDPDSRIELLVEDGTAVSNGAVLLRVEGKARALLTAERSALNTIQHLSGIATLTRNYVDA
ncbi:MAG: nicotinate-nucleotide diphosphorylase (carboxylating), partial [Sphingomonas sp.]|nr:nicotinate-nucleotide diphosphorylase (carboxylating) [Sphingomonas sp.]